MTTGWVQMKPLRLGANEAPPAVVSIFLGDELQGILDAIENDALTKQPEKRP